MAKPKVSTVIPTYARLENFKELVKSIRIAFPPDRVEIMAVTSDDPVSEKGKWLNSQPDVTVLQTDIRTTHRLKSLYAITNMGIKASTGEWIFVTNDNTQIDKEFYSNFVDIEENYDVILVNGHVGDVSLGRRIPVIGTLTSPSDIQRPIFLFDFMIIRKKTFEDIGFFDEGMDWYGAGLDMAMAIETRPHIRVCRENDLSVDHEISQENRTPPNYLKDFEYLENKWQKWCAENGWSFFFPWRREDSFEYVTALLQAGRYDEAEKRIRRVIPFPMWGNHHVQALNDLGVICALRGENSEALDHFLAAANDAKIDFIVIHNLLGALLQMGRRDDAVATLNSSVESVALNGLIVRTALYDAVINNGMIALPSLFHFSPLVTEPTQLLLSNTLTSNSDTLLALYEYAKVLLENKQYESAMEQFKNIIAIDPQHSDAQNSIGLIYHLQGKHGEAMEYFCKAFSHEKLHYEALNNALTLSCQLGITQNALLMLKDVLVKHPEDATLLRIGQSFTAQVEKKKISSNAGVLINVVYAFLQPEHIRHTHRGNVSVIWSAVPIQGCDVYLYMNANSFRGPMSGIDILLMLEPNVVLPGEYDNAIWQHFDYVFSLSDEVCKQGHKFRKILFPRTGWAMEAPRTEDLKEREDKYPIANRKKSICMINGNKSSIVEGELYTKRIEVAQWFYKNSSIPFDEYGTPPFPLSNYRGSLPLGSKADTLKQYTFCLCFENTNDPVYSAGYVSEKILDCLETRTIPIYLGAINIENYIPRSCYIDFRQFHSLEDLNKYLLDLSEAILLQYINNMDEWVATGGLRSFSWSSIYDQATESVTATSNIARSNWFRGDDEWTEGLSPLHKDFMAETVQTEPLWTWDLLMTKRSTSTTTYFLHQTAQLEKSGLIFIGNHAEIKDYVIMRTYKNPIVIGEYAQINPFTVIYGGSGVYIGKNVMIAPHCMISAGNHDYIQTEKPMRFAGDLTIGPIFIEDNVWIGANCTIADGVRIGRDAVVAANSLVNKDVSPYDIVGGVPAKTISNRLTRKLSDPTASFDAPLKQCADQG